MWRIVAVLPILAGLVALPARVNARQAAAPAPAAPGVPEPPHFTYTVVHSWPHDPGAFTQGLVFRDGELLESTGLFGQSTLRRVDLETGTVRHVVYIPPDYFAEGLAVIGDRAYQVTWRSQHGFVFDVATFRLVGSFKYEGEGWGLATDGRWLILSDGTDRLRFLDPATMQVDHTVDVTRAGAPQRSLNELEWVRGEILANVWQTNEIVRIDPASGVVRGVIDLDGLLPESERAPGTDVLNGIAYDAAHDRLLVTGKRWPHLYEIRLRPAEAR